MQKVSAVLLKQPQITALACVAYFTSRATSLDDPFLKDNDKSSSINFTIVSDLIDIPSLSSMCLQISFERNGASGRKIKCEATYFTNLELNFFPSLLLSAASLYQFDENNARTLLMVELLNQYLSSMILKGTCSCFIWL